MTHLTKNIRNYMRLIFKITMIMSRNKMYSSAACYILILPFCLLNLLAQQRESYVGLDKVLPIESRNVSQYTGLDDGYDLNKENPIDSVILFCCFPRDFEIHIYKDKVGYVTGEDDEEDTLSEFFTKATLEDIDALFIQNAVPVELSREKSEFYISGNPCYLDLKIYYGDKIKEEKVVFDSKFDIKYSIRFENLYRRLVNIGRLLYQNSYYYG